MEATERGLAEIAQRVERGTLTGADQIGLAVGPALRRYKVKKHFHVQITDTTFTYERKTEQIDAEAALDGIYVLRTNVPDTGSYRRGVRSYKNLEQVERAFRTFKGPELEIRPIHHHLDDRVRAHVLLCMLAIPHLAPTPRLGAFFKDETPPIQPDPVAKATRSPAAQRKARTKRTSTGETCHGYKSLLAESRRLPATPFASPVAPHLPQARPTHRPPSPRARPRRTRPARPVVTTIQPRTGTKPMTTGHPPTRSGELRLGRISVAYVPPQQGAVSVGFAIPAATATRVADEPLEHGRVRHAYLSLQPAQLTSEIARELHVTVGGVLVYALAPDGPAAKAGIRPGDVLTAVGGQKVASAEELFAALRQHDPGEGVAISYVRDDGTHTAHAQITDRPS